MIFIQPGVPHWHRLYPEFGEVGCKEARERRKVRRGWGERACTWRQEGDRGRLGRVGEARAGAPHMQSSHHAHRCCCPTPSGGRPVLCRRAGCRILQHTGPPRRRQRAWRACCSRGVRRGFDQVDSSLAGRLRKESATGAATAPATAPGPVAQQSQTSAPWASPSRACISANCHSLPCISPSITHCLAHNSHPPNPHLIISVAKPAPVSLQRKLSASSE